MSLSQYLKPRNDLIKLTKIQQIRIIKQAITAKMRQLNSKITTTSGQNSSLKYATAQMQGTYHRHIGWRPEMEDAFITNTSLKNGESLFAVFDGHGGKHVSKYLQQHFVEVLQKSQLYLNKNYSKALEQTFKNIDNILLTETGIQKQKQYGAKSSLKMYPSGLTGSTANVVLLTGEKIYVANCGDSRCAMFYTKHQNNKTEYKQLSFDHKPDNQLQKQRIQKAGGFVSTGRVQGNLSLSRAFGDHFYKQNQKISYRDQKITCHPDVYTYPYPTEASNFNILIGCDGIWQNFQGSSAGLLQLVRLNYLLGMNIQENAKDILNTLVSRHPVETKGKGCDNMTLILLHISHESWGR